MKTRPVAEDAEAILAVCSPYVRNTAITFEYEETENRLLSPFRAGR